MSTRSNQVSESPAAPYLCLMTPVMDYYCYDHGRFKASESRHAPPANLKSSEDNRNGDSEGNHDNHGAWDGLRAT